MATSDQIIVFDLLDRLINRTPRTEAADMISYGLQLLNFETKRLIESLPLNTQPYGTFAVGQIFTWRGQSYRIMEVGHLLLPQDDGTMHAFIGLSLQ